MNPQTYDDWLDAEGTFDPAKDPNPERDFAAPGPMAKILGISERHLRRLVKAGVVEQRADGTFHRMETLNRFVAKKASEPLPASTALRSRQEQILARRLERDAAESISMPEALNTFDEITDGFVDSIAQVRREAAKGRSLAERQHIASVIASATDRLKSKFAEEREALRTGRKGGEE